MTFNPNLPPGCDFEGDKAAAPQKRHKHAGIAARLQAEADARKAREASFYDAPLRSKAPATPHR